MDSEDIRAGGEVDATTSPTKGERIIVLLVAVFLMACLGFMILTYASTGDCAAPSFGPNIDCRPGPLSAPHPGAAVYAWATFAAAATLLTLGFSTFGILARRARTRAQREALRVMQFLKADEIDALISGTISTPQLLAEVQQRVKMATAHLEALAAQVEEMEQRTQIAQAIAELNERQAQAVSASWAASLDEFERRGVRRDVALLLLGALLGALLSLPVAWVAQVLFAAR